MFFSVGTGDIIVIVCVLCFALVSHDDVFARVSTRSCLEAFPVDNGGARLIVLLLADPHLLEGGGANLTSDADDAPRL